MGFCHGAARESQLRSLGPVGGLQLRTPAVLHDRRSALEQAAALLATDWELLCSGLPVDE